MTNVYYISNMFPGKKDNYGIFTKITLDFFRSDSSFNILGTALIKGKSNNKIWNIFRYIILLVKIFVGVLVLNKRIDVIYIQYIWKHAFFVTHMLKFINKHGIKIVLNFHGEDLLFFYKLSSYDKEKFIRLLHYSSLIVVPSNYFSSVLHTINNKMSTKILVSPSGGVNSSIFYNTNLQINRNRIIYCSRFDVDKGWDDFINAISICYKKNREITATMIGYGKQIDKVKEMIVGKSMVGVIYLIENPKQEIIAEWYNKSGLFVFPTRLSESLGLVALEAMSCGLPIIASDIGAIPEYITDGENGLLFEAGNVYELSRSIMHFCSFSDYKISLMRKKSIHKAQKYQDYTVKLRFLDSIKLVLNNED